MSYQGIDYTFRNTLNNLISNPKLNNNNNKNNNVIKTESDFDIERTRRKNNLKIQPHISDLENTVSLNQECINNMIPLLQLNQTQKNKLIASIKKITNYFNDKKAYRKKKNEINSKMLINKQIIEEIKRRRDEGYLMYKEQMTNLSESVTKKTSLVKQFQKKFSEVEIFIQRESQTEEHIDKYGKWKTFTVIPFMKRNEDILKKKCFYEEEINKRKKEIKNLEKENEVLKDNNEINNISILYGPVGYGFRSWNDDSNSIRRINRLPYIHKEIMEYGLKYCDKFYLTSNDPATCDPMDLITDCLNKVNDCDKIKVIVDRKEAIKQMILDSEENDVIYIAGRGDRKVFCKNEYDMDIYKDSDVVLEVINNERCN